MAAASVWDTRRGWLLVAFWGGLAAMPLLLLIGIIALSGLAWIPPYRVWGAAERLAIGLVLWTPVAAALGSVAGALVLARRRAAWWWTAPAGCAVCVSAIGVAAVTWALAP